MDVSSGMHGESSKGICPFHGTPWRINGRRLCAGRDITACDKVYACIQTCIKKSLGCKWGKRGF